MNDSTAAEMAALCQCAWGLHAVDDVSRLEPEPGSAALYRVVADGGVFLLTKHRDGRGVADLRRADQAAVFLVGRGLTTPTCRSTLEGTPVASIEGSLYTLRPWVPGSPLSRERLTEGEMSLLGRTLGWCHRLLAGLPHAPAVAWPTRVSSTVEEIDALAGCIASTRKATEADRQVLEVLASRRSLLQDAPDLAASFSPYPAQVVHGDYHVDNVIVDGEGKLSGVIDLEPILGYPVWEVYYAIWWSLRAWDIGAFETPLARAFVCGYLEEARLTPEELRAGPELLYWWLLLATWDARRYAKDPADLDALNGVLWFYRLARWLGRHGGQLGTELASLARSQ